jgi:GGDEF domain-containing protein
MKKPDSSPDALRACQELLASRTAELAHLREMMDAFLPLDIDTGLLNRNGVIEAVRRCLLWWHRRREYFAILVVHLPEISNATPEERPALVRHISATIAATMRAVDEAGRLDDATYVIVLRDFRREGVAVVAERIGASLRAAAGDVTASQPQPRMGICLVADREGFVPGHYVDAAFEAAMGAVNGIRIVEA